MQKIKTCLSIKQGSALVYSLIIMGAMLFIATSVSVISITEKKSASSTESSTQAFQTADSGFQLALKQINLHLADNLNTLANELSSACSIEDGKAVIKDIDGAGPSGSKYTLYLDAGSNPVCGTTTAKDITVIKSVGTYKNTVRAVEVAMAANVSLSPGAVVAYTTKTCPSGWVQADGDNGTPDLRGQFIRGRNTFDDGATTRSDGKQDPDGTRSMGDYQADEFKSHTHSGVPSSANGFLSDIGGNAARTLSGNTGATGGNETRPKNVALIYCVYK
jgi:hypothetical protein